MNKGGNVNSLYEINQMFFQMTVEQREESIRFMKRLLAEEESDERVETFPAAEAVV